MNVWRTVMNMFYRPKHTPPPDPPPCGKSECLEWDKQRALESEHERERRLRELREDMELAVKRVIREQRRT